MGLCDGGSSHKSNITSLGTALDPMHYVWKATTGKDYVNDFINSGTEGLNGALSKVVGPLDKLSAKIDPVRLSLDKTFGQPQIIQDINNTVRNRPLDAAAMAAAAYFGAGAMAGGEGASAGGSAALQGAGSGGATGAMDAAGGYTFGSGANAAMGSAITPAFESGVGATAGAGSMSVGGAGVASTIPEGMGAASGSAMPASLSGDSMAASVTPGANSGIATMDGAGSSTFDKINNGRKLLDNAQKLTNNNQQQQQAPARRPVQMPMNTASQPSYRQSMYQPQMYGQSYAPQGLLYGQQYDQTTDPYQIYSPGLLYGGQ